MPNPGIVSETTRRPLTDAERELTDAHLHLCDRAARTFARKYPFLDRDDFTSAAFLGLAAAAKRYEPWRGVKFVTYATTCIRGACVDMMRANPFHAVRVTRDDREDGHRALVFSIDDLGRRDAFFDTTRSQIHLELPPADVPDPGRDLESADVFEALQVGLSDRERAIVRGLYGPASLTPAEVADRLGVGRRYLYRLHDEIKGRVRDRAIRLGLSPGA